MGEKKLHYKMYKDGKKFVFAAIATLSFFVFGGVSTVAVHADTTSGNLAAATVNSTSDTKSAVSSAATVASSSSATKADSTSANNSSAVNAETTGASSSSATNADSTGASSGSAVNADSTSANNSSAVNAGTTSASSSSAVNAETTSANNSSAVNAETTGASSSSATNADSTGASSGSAVNADSTSANNSSAVNAGTTSASSSSAVNAETTSASSSSAVNAETTSAKTRQTVTKISYNTLLQQLPTSKALATDKEALTHVTKDNFLAYFSLNGSATYDQNTGIVTITPEDYNKVGNFSLKSKIDMNTSFTLTSKVNLGSNPNGADGIGFAFHNGNTTDIGNAGGNLGIGGLQDALGFKLDTWSNAYQVPLSDKDGSQIDSTNSNDFGWNGDSMNAPYGTFVDTENEEVATKDGKKVQRWWAKDVGGTSQALSKSDVNGQFHDFTVDYDGDTRTLAIKYTQTSGKILTWTRTISNSNQAMAMIVSASTGGAKNLQQFEIMSFDFKQAATVNVKYVDTKGNQIAQGEVTYPNGANVNGTYTTGQLEIPGYTFVRMDDGTATGAKSLPATGTLTKAGDNGTVIYVYTADQQKGSVSYVDDKTGKTLKTDSISGTTGSKSSYSTSGSIADYKKQGYELVTDGYPADFTFDNDDTTDQNFTVHLKHQNIQSTEAKTVTETIHYQGAGNQTPADNTAQVTFTRQVSTDAVTGE
ncbi:lectin-like domain-containing protein, partial [Lactiplantibacillus pentosus]